MNVNLDVVSNKLQGLIISFCDVLKSKYGFEISTDGVLIAVENIYDSNVFEKEQLEMMLRALLCKSRGDVEVFSQVFNDFFRKESLKNYAGLMSALKEETIEQIKTPQINQQTESDVKKNECSEKYSIYEEEIREIIEEINIDKVVIPDVLNVCKQNKTAINEMVCKYLIGDDDRLSLVKKCLEGIMLRSIKRSSQLTKYLLECAELLSAELRRIQEIVDKQKTEAAIRAREIEKNMSKAHREEYIQGKNSVKTISDIIDNNIVDLSDQDIAALSVYIKQNAHRFKTKIAANMKKSKSKSIDFKSTVKKSIRSDGVPFFIEHKKPVASRTKIITICDVSGSCIQSARMLLNFIYELQSVFSRGCESYVFVSDIADVTSEFKKYSVNEACNKAIAAVPRKYSNYGAALESFERCYSNHVNKDTIIIFLGDARNNRNKSRCDIIKKISEKSKAIYWLNPENQSSWGEGDSAINEYRKYLKEVYQVIKPRDIIDFLCNMR